MKMERMLYLMIGIIGLTLTADLTTAAEYTWNGGGGADTNWTTSANWGGSGYPHVSGDIAVVSAGDTIALDASVTLGRIYMNSATAKTVTVAETGAADITVGGQSIPIQGFYSGADNWLVLQPDIAASGRVDFQGTGTLEFQGAVTIPGGGYLYVQHEGKTVFSGDSSLSMASGIAGIGLLSTETQVILTNTASWVVNELQTGVSSARTGPVVFSQDGDGTSVQAEIITLGFGGTQNGYSDTYYLRKGFLSAGSIVVGKNIPGVFEMTGGTFLLRGGDITTESTLSSCEFRLGGGMLQVSNPISGVFSYGRIPMKISGAPTLEIVGSSRLYQLASVSGSADLTKAGTGPLVIDTGTTNTISGSLLISSGNTQLNPDAMIESYDGSTNAWAVTIRDGGLLALAHDTSIITQPLDLNIESGGRVYFANPGGGSENRNIIVARTFVVNGVTKTMGRYMKPQLTGVIDGAGYGAIVVPATWTGAAGDGKWSTGANWSTGVYPTGDNGVADLSLATGPITLDTDVRLTCLIYNPQGAERELTLTGSNAIEFWPVTTSPNLFVGPGRKLILDVPVTLPSNENYNGLIYGDGTVVFNKSIPVRLSNPVLAVYGTMTLTGTNLLGSTGALRVGARGASHIGTVILDEGCVLTCTHILNHSAMLSVSGNYNSNYPVYPVNIIHDGADVSTTHYVWVARHQPYTPPGPFGYSMHSGSLITGSTTYGIELGNRFSGTWNRYPGGRFDMTGGTVDTYRLSLGFSDNVISLQGGDITLGAGGIVFTDNTANVPTEYQSYVAPGTVNLGGVVLHAKAAWGSVLDMTLTGVNGNTVVSNATYSISLNGDLSGEGGIVKMGNATLSLGGTNTFTGPVSVAEGSLVVDHGLVNATNLSITASGALLSLGSANSLNTNATLTVAAGGMINLNYSGAATINALVVNGQEKSPGTYGSGKPYITGTGTLVVRSGPPPGGTLIIIQ
ncbi:MAG: hypothetical protein PF904_05185 [Kiritimatiellae bacterium]|jgi:autotransporter-associated beta strand protein|nr:hypothetical protein [Kiritimatiellia bacterium]